MDQGQRRPEFMGNVREEVDVFHVQLLGHLALDFFRFRLFFFLPRQEPEDERRGNQQSDEDKAEDFHREQVHPHPDGKGFRTGGHVLVGHPETNGIERPADAVQGNLRFVE